MRRVRQATVAALEAAGLLVVAAGMYGLVTRIDDLLALLAP